MDNQLLIMVQRTQVSFGKLPSVAACHHEIQGTPWLKRCRCSEQAGLKLKTGTTACSFAFTPFGHADAGTYLSSKRKVFHFDGKGPSEAGFENMPRFEGHRGAPGPALLTRKMARAGKTLEIFQSPQEGPYVCCTDIWFATCFTSQSASFAQTQ
jgi:hypothetical protein